MDYQKIDPGLSIGIDNGETSFSVFLHTYQPITDAENTVLQQMGIDGQFVGKKSITLSCSLQQVDKLSEQSWVKRIIKAQKLNTLK